MEMPVGAAYVLVEEDSVVELRGVGENGRGKAVDGGTVFRAGSIGKTVIAMAVMRMVEEGEMQMGMEVAKVLSDMQIENPYSKETPVTVEHLLEHTAGFDDMHFSEYYVDEPMDLGEALAEFPASKHCRWRPGSRAAYSNIDFAMLALLGERISGLAWKEWLKKSVLDPLQMNRSGFGLPPKELGNLSIGHVRGLPLEAPPRYRYEPSLSFYTCAEDLGKLLACLNSGDQGLISPSSIDRMRSTRTNPNLKEMGKSLGAGLQRDYVNGWEMWYHTGKVDGQSGIFELYPGQGRAFAVLYNSQPRGGVRTAALTKGCRKWAMPLRKDIPKDASVLKADSLKRADWQSTCLALANPRNEMLGKYDRLMTTVDFERGIWEAEINGERYFRTKGGGMYKAGQLHVGAVEGGGFLQVGTDYFEECPCWRAPLLRVLDRVLRCGSILLLLGMLVEAFTPRLSGKRRIDLGLLLGVVPYWLAQLGFWLLTSSDFKTLGTISPSSVAFFLLSLLIPMLALLGIFRLLIYLCRNPQSLRWGIFLPFAAANAAIAMYMVSEGLVGMRLWAW